MNNRSVTFLVLLTGTVLVCVAAQPHMILASQEQKASSTKKLDPNQPVLSPSAFSYQGQLKENGLPASGAYDFQFSLYTAQVAGEQVGSAVKDGIIVASGSFSVPLDFGNMVFMSGEAVWMEVALRPSNTTDNFTVLSPRQRLTPTPYALLAQADSWNLIGVPVGFTESGENEMVTVNRIADGQIVKSINSLKDDVTLAAGTNVTITPNGNTLTIAASGGAGWVNDKGVVRLTTDTESVGIGVREPTAKLDVAGDIRARGALRSGNSMTFDGSDHTITATTVAGQSFSKQIRIGYKDAANPGSFSDIRIGIGTLTPLRSVDVLNDQAVLRLTTLASAAGSALEFQNNVASSTVLGAISFLESNAAIGNAVGQISYLSPPTNAMTFRTNNAERVRITSSGSVGIGTTTPGNTLHVAGGVRVDTLANPTPTNTVPVCRNSNNDLSLCGGAAISWLVTGNTGTTAANFLGTLDNNFLAFRTNNLERMRITTFGNVGIGVADATEALHVAGRIRVEQLAGPASDHLCISQGVIATCSGADDSDARFKTNLMPLTNVLEKLAGVRGVSFEWNETYQSLRAASRGREIGVIAQEVEAVFPELVTERDDGYKRVAYEKLTAVLIEAVKELKAENEALKQRIERLEKAASKR
jgi:hypothetical protein